MAQSPYPEWPVFTSPPLAGSACSLTLPRTYIYCLDKASWTSPLLLAAKDGLLRTAAAAREAGWRYCEMATTHFPMRDAPKELRDLLLEVAPAREIGADGAETPRQP